MFEEFGHYYIVCYWDRPTTGHSAPVGKLCKQYTSETWAIKRAKLLLDYPWCYRVRVLRIPIMKNAGYNGDTQEWYAIFSDDVSRRQNVFEKGKVM